MGIIGRRSRPVRASLLCAASIAIACGASPIERPVGSSGVLPAPTPTVQMLNTYTSEFGFAVDYPAEFEILAEPLSLPESRPPLLHRIRFQTHALARSAFAEREPPKLKIEIFAAAPGSLLDWLRSFDRIPRSAEVLPFTVAGSREALQVADRRLLAPNTSYYVSAPRYVFALTPLDDTGSSMVLTFRLLPPQ